MSANNYNSDNSSPPETPNGDIHIFDFNTFRPPSDIWAPMPVTRMYWPENVTSMPVYGTHHSLRLPPNHRISGPSSSPMDTPVLDPSRSFTPAPPGYFMPIDRPDFEMLDPFYPVETPIVEPPGFLIPYDESFVGMTSADVGSQFDRPNAETLSPDIIFDRSNATTPCENMVIDNADDETRMPSKAHISEIQRPVSNSTSLNPNAQEFRPPFMMPMPQDPYMPNFRMFRPCSPTAPMPTYYLREPRPFLRFHLPLIPGPEFRMPTPNFRYPGPELRIPRLEYRMPGPNVRTPGPDLTMPGPDLKMPGSDVSMPGPDFRMSGPDFRMSGPNFRMSSPELRLPGMNLRMPGPDLGIAGLDIRLPIPILGMTRPDLRLPGPNLRMPGPFFRMSGPEVTMLGPHIRMNGPDLRMAGPHLRIPRSDLRMPRPVLRIPGPEFRMPGLDFRHGFWMSRPYLEIPSPYLNMPTVDFRMPIMELYVPGSRSETLGRPGRYITVFRQSCGTPVWPPMYPLLSGILYIMGTSYILMPWITMEGNVYYPYNVIQINDDFGVYAVNWDDIPRILKFV